MSNLHFVKDFLKLDQGGVSIHRINDLFPLKPPLAVLESGIGTYLFFHFYFKAMQCETVTVLINIV